MRSTVPSVIATVVLVLTATECGAQQPAPFSMPPAQTAPSKQKTPLAKKLLSGIGHGITDAAAAVAGDADLPPTVEDNPSWPFPVSKRLPDACRIVWTDGSRSDVVPREDGGFDIRGGDGNGTTVIPDGDGFAIVTGDGNFANMQKTPDGGYQILKGDGSCLTLKRNSSGGYTIFGAGGPVATIVAGPGGHKYGLSWGGKGVFD